MIKYEICTESSEIKLSNRTYKPMTAEEVFDAYWGGDQFDELIVASFDTLEEAQTEWDKNYKNYGKTVYRSHVIPFLEIDVAFLRSAEYDDADGEYDHMIDACIAFSAEGYNP